MRIHPVKSCEAYCADCVPEQFITRDPGLRQLVRLPHEPKARHCLLISVYSCKGDNLGIRTVTHTHTQIVHRFPANEGLPDCTATYIARRIVVML
jgi:hypothetical protein